MGWCSGTEIFDSMCGVIIDNTAIGELEQFRLTRYLVETLENHDWDCQSDSEYYDHPLVRKIFKELHPEWYEEEMDELQNERNHLAKLLFQMINKGNTEFSHDKAMFLKRYEQGYYK